MWKEINVVIVYPPMNVHDVERFLMHRKVINF